MLQVWPLKNLQNGKKKKRLLKQLQDPLKHTHEILIYILLTLIWMLLLQSNLDHLKVHLV